ncbi:thiamine kinase [Legionella lansingensis]|uniref:Choline/ethanolamine kinase n=1 Tax=Legionella lansingensis TaxID=45067 RepID=A0A0W0VUF1_9GAMM|nr:aminoglycoside phosphotransferase family protein [Legionella lansingensis]KTD23605.1 Choline/ethanolamine kinase [Legionella lansingensis]SNV52391.1 thiamine kinase [Legionella lansingensis]
MPGSEQHRQVRDFLYKYYPNSDLENMQIAPLKGGIATTIFKVNLSDEGKEYCVVVRKNPEQIDLRDYNREILFQDFCSAAEIGPKILYRDSDYTLMEFIHGEWPLPETLDKPQLTSIANSIRILHSADLTINLSDAHFLFQLKQMLKEKNSDPEKEELLVRARHWIEQVGEFFYKDSHLCPCHLDLNPGNILLSQQNKTFLVDFTDSHCDDKFIDLGKFAAYMGLGANEKITLLKSYFSGEPSRKQIALLNIAQMLFELRLGMVGLLNIKSDAELKELLANQDLNADSKKAHHSLIHDYLHGNIQDENIFYKRLVDVYYLSWKQKIESKEYLEDMHILSNPSYQSFFDFNISAEIDIKSNKQNVYN